MENDKLLSVQTSDDECLYRIQRGDRVVHVEITGSKFLTGYKRNYGPAVIEWLQGLKEWTDSWTNLHVIASLDGGIRCKLDSCPPFKVSADLLLDRYPRYDFERLSIVRQHKSRTYEVQISAVSENKFYFLKLARFSFEIEWVAREIRAYHQLETRSLSPKLAGYVFETRPDRVIGFLTEKVEGNFPSGSDLEECEQALDKLHDYLIHGDLVKYNIIMSPRGPRFIDFEDSILIGTERWSRDASDKEKHTLGAKLADVSDAGRPRQID